MSVHDAVTDDDYEVLRKMLDRMQAEFEKLDPQVRKERTERVMLVGKHVAKQGIWSVEVKHTPIYPRRRRNPPIGTVKA
jgi:hypothetical protein